MISRPSRSHYLATAAVQPTHRRGCQSRSRLRDSRPARNSPLHPHHHRRRGGSGHSPQTHRLSAKGHRQPHARVRRPAIRSLPADNFSNLDPNAAPLAHAASTTRPPKTSPPPPWTMPPATAQNRRRHPRRPPEKMMPLPRLSQRSAATSPILKKQIAAAQDQLSPVAIANQAPGHPHERSGPPGARSPADPPLRLPSGRPWVKSQLARDQADSRKQSVQKLLATTSSNPSTPSARSPTTSKRPPKISPSPRPSKLSPKKSANSPMPSRKIPTIPSSCRNSTTSKHNSTS